MMNSVMASISVLTVENVVTTDVAMFYMGGSYGQHHVCQVRSNETDLDKLKFIKQDAFMVWTDVSFYGRTTLIFINKGVKVISKYNILNVLKPFLKKDVPCLFTGRENDTVFHQASASSLTAKMTIDFLKKHKVSYVTSKSPDAAPIDFGIWGVLKCRLQKCKIFTTTGLTKALKDKRNKLEQSCINWTLESWPRRYRMIYYCHGS